MRCRRFLPSKPLRDYIAWYWTLENTTADLERYRLVPDAYVDWVFHLGEPWSFTQRSTSNPKKQYQSHVFGHSTRFIELELGRGTLQVFGIKFQPWAAHLFWQADMHETTDREIELRDLSLPKMSELNYSIQAAASTQEHISIAEKYLSKRIKKQKNLQILIQNLSSETFQKKRRIDDRRLQQRFKTEVGISPKIYWRTIRINAVINEMLPGKKKLTDIAYKFGYFDQSHFIKDFKNFTGLSPKVFLKSINPSEDFFNLRVG